MDPSITVALIAGVGVIVTAMFGLAGNRKGALVTQEKEFRTAILEDNKELRGRLEAMEIKLNEVLTENTKLKLEKMQWADKSMQSEGGHTHAPV